MVNLTEVPSDLPVPVDDGACDHLPGVVMPGIALRSTEGRFVDLSALSGKVVVYCYPMTGRPEVALPDGWDQIPGARGCTPQSCSFRDHHAELRALGASVFGLSTQSSEYQQEAVERLHLPFELLSDSGLELSRALSLPLFQVDEHYLIRRLTLVLEEGRVAKMFYPVFPPDKNAEEVIAWLTNGQAAG